MKLWASIGVPVGFESPAVQDWLAKHPRFNMHFTPSASWLNMVERFFRDITTERLRRGVFTSVSERNTRCAPPSAECHGQPPRKGAVA